LKICTIPVPVYISPHNLMILNTLQVYIFIGWTDSHNYKLPIFTRLTLMFGSNIYLVALLLKEMIYKKRIGTIFRLFLFTYFLLEYEIQDLVILLHFSFKNGDKKHGSALFFLFSFYYFFVFSILNFLISFWFCLHLSVFSLVINSKVRKVLY